MSILQKLMLHDIKQFSPGVVVILRLTPNIVTSYLKVDSNQWNFFTKNEIKTFDDDMMALFMSDFEYIVVNDWAGQIPSTE